MAIEYQARITREGRHWLADFPDCPGCQTFAGSRDAVEMAAREALEGWLEAALQERDVPPDARRHRGGEWMLVRINPQLAAKVALRQARHRAGLSQKQLADRMGVSQQAVAKLEDPDRNFELDTLARAAEALGHVVALDLVPA